MNTLENNKNKPLFDVPEHYFEQLQHNVMQRAMKEEKQQKKSKKWISATSAAASIAIIVVLSVYLIVNRDPNEHFYVLEGVIQSEDTLITLDSNCLAEVREVTVKELTEVKREPETLSSKAPLVAKETIVYRAVDFYVDDYEVYNFCEVMYDLECFYDY
ncbi:MAG: hypothetical protein FWC34_07305 [Bacteroidetes bacterium]|nr:hypothetical protein [Bacteroidota bacterium]MCL2302803.1 hypothetical protein [Lentimicrobiaceae bacterium]